MKIVIAINAANRRKPRARAPPTLKTNVIDSRLHAAAADSDAAERQYLQLKSETKRGNRGFVLQ